MSIFLTKKTRVIVQGITGHQGRFHTLLMLQYGTKVVAGVTPGKGGRKVEGVPVYDTVKEACKKHPVDFSVLFVPAPFIKKAAFEALDANLHLVIITEHVPVHDTIAIIAKAKQKKRMVVGPNCPGITSVGKAKIGIMPAKIFKKGSVGIVSRSGTLTYEIINLLSKAGMGQSTAVGIGGDPIVGMNFEDVLKQFEQDKQTKQIVLIGEIGGDVEERAADYIAKHVKKKVVAYIAGRTAQTGKRMGHAGAIIIGHKDTAEYKIAYLEKKGIPVAQFPSEIIELLRKR